MAIRNPVTTAKLPSILNENSKNPIGENTPQARRVLRLARWLRSPGLEGQVLRVLLYYVKKPALPYRDTDLEILLLLSAAAALNDREDRTIDRKIGPEDRKI